MSRLIDAQWLLLLLYSGIASIIGILLSYFLPAGRVREYVFNWSPIFALFLGLTLGVTAGVLLRPTLTLPIAALAAYLGSRLPDFSSFLRGMVGSEDEATEFLPDRMQLRSGWNARPRYESAQPGQFVGRTEFVDRLSSHFMSEDGGTILISGVRGVGKTALVDRALVSAREELASSYWQQIAKYLAGAPRWHVIDHQVKQKMLRFEAWLRLTRSTESKEFQQLQRAAQYYFFKRPRRFWPWLDPVDLRIRRMHEASRSQMFILKFSASDISGALAEPGQDSEGKPRINPEKLLRSVIRKLYVTCMADRGQAEVGILEWSLRDKKERDRFFGTLAAAYKKSISKSYKEIITNSLNDLIKRSRSSALKGTLNVERVVLLLACVAIGVGGTLAGWTRAWRPLESYIAGGVGALVALYFTATWTFSSSRESSSDSARQAQSSYEYDYSLEQMQTDLEELMGVFRSPEDDKFYPYRCFTRSVIVFDELDKLENADEQLDDVITHFKNFFTLSRAVFVFLTDHEFYEYLARETVKAQVNRHYPPQHTFFTEKIYLRKPEFHLFREAFYRFANPDWLTQRVRSLPPDPVLVGYLLEQNDESLAAIESLPLQTLTQLYIKRSGYKPHQTAAIETEFQARKGLSDPLAVAQIWASQVSSKADASVLEATRKSFNAARGWTNPDAVALLYFDINDFGAEDQKKIATYYKRINEPPLTRYTTVDDGPFTLSDLAHAICFQTRNHYFDLYNTIYDYVGSYDRGAPILHLEDSKFTHESRLWSRYQQLLEIAFGSAKENHSSREYFNALLMETLYRVFDNRGSGNCVSIAEVLFSANGKKSPSALPDPIDPPPTNPEPTAFTTRDSEKIDNAVVRLLRLALAHNVIIGQSPNFEALIKSDPVKIPALAGLVFSWNDNAHSIITGMDAEEYEGDLIKFWDKHKSELDLVDIELGRLWSGLSLPEEAVRSRNAISELRSKAEGLRLKSIKVSRPDAMALQSNVGTAETRDSLMSRLVLERIRAEDDAEILDDLRKSTTSKAAPSHLESRKREFESNTGQRTKAVISPRDTDLIIFLIASPIPVDFTNKLLVDYLSNVNGYVFYYAFTRDTSELVSIDKVRFYSSPPNSPSTSKLFSDYVQIACQARLEKVLAHLKASNYQEDGLVLRAGAEILGPVTSESELQQVLARPAVVGAVTALSEARVRFEKSGQQAWLSYDIATTGKSVPQAISELAGRLAARITDPGIEIENLIASALSLSTDLSKFTLESWVRFFVGSPPLNVERLLLQGILTGVMSKRIKAFAIVDRDAEAIILGAFVPEAVKWIVDLANAKDGDLIGVLASPDLPAEIEHQRRLRRFNPPLPDTPNAPPKKRLSRRTSKTQK